MTVVVTRNVPERHRGFLASVMLEVAPGTYVSPDMTRGVRERVWQVLVEWASLLPPDGAVTMLWPDRAAPGNIAVANLGAPKVELVEHDGLWLERHDLRRDESALL